MKRIQRRYGNLRDQLPRRQLDGSSHEVETGVKPNDPECCVHPPHNLLAGKPGDFLA